MSARPVPVHPSDQWPAIGWRLALRFIVSGRHHNRRPTVDAVNGAIQQTDLPTGIDQAQSPGSNGSLRRVVPAITGMLSGQV